MTNPPCSPEKGSLAARCLVALFSFTVAVILAECLLRWSYPVAAETFTWDSTKIYRQRPRSHKLFVRNKENGGDLIPVSFNSSGHRGPEPPSSQEPRLRVAVYGDSFIAAEFSRFPETFCEQLRGRLETDRGHPVEMLNSGVTGYGLGQSVLHIEEELASIKPDLILLAICSGNDTVDFFLNKLFRLNEDSELVSNKPFVPADIRSPLQVHTMLHPRGWLLFRTATRARRRFLREYSYARQHADANYDPVANCLGECDDEYESFILQNDDTVRHIVGNHYDAGYALYPGSEASQYKRQLVSRSLQRLNEHLNSHSVPLAIMIIPSVFDLVNDFSDLASGLHKRPEYDPTRLTQLYEAVAQQQSIPCLNLYRQFHDNEPDTLYFPVFDTHWNDQGQALAAELAAEFIAQTFPPHE